MGGSRIGNPAVEAKLIITRHPDSVLKNLKVAKYVQKMIQRVDVETVLNTK